MRAACHIGRVGGLAVALGIGAAAFGVTSVAWADAPSTGSSGRSGSAHSVDSGSADRGGQSAPRYAGPKASKSPAATPSAAVDVALPARSKAGPALNRSRTAAPSGTSVAALIPVSTSGEAAAPTAGSAGDVDSPQDDAPVLPADSLANVTLFDIVARRQTTSAAAAVLPSASSVSSLAEDVIPTGVNVALIMGDSGDPIPDEQYVQSVYELYIAPNSPAGTVPYDLFTPEGLYPITGVKTLPLNTSVDQGMTILADEIRRQLAAGNTITVFGYSQSADLSSLLMPELDPDTPINFVFVGNEMNPNGGFLSRFPDLTLPSLGIDFYGPTPEDLFAVANYSLEYDGFADFPRYAGNFLSVLNAGFGLAFVHLTYPDITPEQVASAIQLPTSTPSQQYYVIPTENLPLLEPLRWIPLIGDPLADLLQPALRVIVNLGYGDPNYGWSTEGYANENLTFSVFPHVNWLEVADLLIKGVQQGIQDFIADITPGGVFWQDLEALATPKSDTISSLESSSSNDGLSGIQSFVTNAITTIQTVVTNVVNFISNGASSLYSALLPTADIVNALVTSLPAYALTLFLDGIEQVLNGDVFGGLVYSIAMPWAASIGLATMAALIELLVVAQGVEGIFIPVS